MHDKIETLRLITRTYDVSSTGALSVSQYLRYLEHIRWRTIATSSKLPLRNFWALGVVRSQVLEIYRPVMAFDVELELSVWMSRLGKTSIDFSHDVVRCSDGVLVARSSATIVALDAERRPAVIGDGAAAYLVERETIRAERLGDVPPHDAWEHRVHVRPSDHDLQQHVNHARYADFVEDARTECSQAGGYGPGTWDDGPRRFTIAYEHEIRAGDPVVARTWCTKGRERCAELVLMNGPDVVATRARVDLVGSSSNV